MKLAQFINEKILDPAIAAKVIAPRLAAQEEQLRAEAAAAARAKAVAAARDAAQAKMIAAVVAAVRAEMVAEITEAVRAGITAAICAEVKAAVNERWAGWLARRDAVLAEGRDFDEPRPDAGNHPAN